MWSCNYSIKKYIFSVVRHTYFVSNRENCAVTSIIFLYLQWLGSLPVFFLTQKHNFSYCLCSCLHLPIFFFFQNKHRNTQLSFHASTHNTPFCCMVFLKRDRIFLQKYPYSKNITAKTTFCNGLNLTGSNLNK